MSNQQTPSEWYEENKRRFHTCQMSGEEIARSGYVAGQMSRDAEVKALREALMEVIRCNEIEDAQRIARANLREVSCTCKDYLPAEHGHTDPKCPKCNSALKDHPEVGK